MQAKNLKSYKATQILTADPGRIILMLYNASISSLEQAAAHAKQQEIEDRSRLAIKAKDIIFELMGALDYDQGGTIAENLQQIYTFLIAEILKAEIENDAELFLKCRDILIPLREAWAQITEKPTAYGAAAAPTATYAVSRTA